MLFEDLATELVMQVLFSCTSINDVLALAATCRRFRAISLSSSRLAMLAHAAEAQYGPLSDLTQLLTHNASQPAHTLRSVPLSLALLKQMAHAGRIAAKWCAIYPSKKWKLDYASRRLLTRDEMFRLRRAIYRIWLYARAFHNAAHPRESRVTRPEMLRRAALLHNWSTRELGEMADASAVIRAVVQNNICPSNGAVARKFAKRHPGSGTDSLLFNMHAPALHHHHHTHSAPHNPFTNQTPAANPNLWHTIACSSAAYTRRAPDPAAEGWGDAISHYYVVEDYMKLDPEQVLWLREHARCKGEVQGYVRLLGGWFDNNGATLGQTIEWVLEERGEERGEEGEGFELGEAGGILGW